MKRLTLIAFGLILSVVTTQGTGSEPDMMTVKDFSSQDQAKIQDLYKTVSDINKDIELAQTKIQLAQAQLTRVNEVQLPALEQELRDAYKLPKDQWDWNLQTLTFTRKKERP